MQRYRAISDYCSQLLQRASDGDVSGALQAVVDVVDEVSSYASSYAEVLGSADLDALCQKIGRLSLGEVDSPSRPNEGVVVLVSGLGRSGGHSRVVADLLREEGGGDRTVLVTNIRPGVHDAQAEYLIEQCGASVNVAPQSASLAERLSWVQARLLALCPRRIYLVLHPFDVVGVAAPRPDLASTVYFLHTADHSLALGARCSSFKHVDFNAKSYVRCCSEGVVDGAIIPLVATDPEPDLARPCFTRGHLTTCTSGNFEKFDFSRFRDPLRYKFGYPEGVGVILEASRGTHIHIGSLTEQTVGQIHEAIARAGTPHDRFVHIPFVENLSIALIDHGVDCYVGSFPWGGGRATVEAMSAGLPLVIHSQYRSILFGVENEVYEHALRWRNFVDLRSYILSLDTERLRQHRGLSRDHYLKHHTYERLGDGLRRLWAGEKPHAHGVIERYDPLQVFLDEHPNVIG